MNSDLRHEDLSVFERAVKQAFDASKIPPAPADIRKQVASLRAEAKAPVRSSGRTWFGAPIAATLLVAAVATVVIGQAGIGGREPTIEPSLGGLFLEGQAREGQGWRLIAGAPNLRSVAPTAPSIQFATGDGALRTLEGLALGPQIATFDVASEGLVVLDFLVGAAPGRCSQVRFDSIVTDQAAKSMAFRIENGSEPTVACRFGGKWATIAMAVRLASTPVGQFTARLEAKNVPGVWLLVAERSVTAR